MTAWNSCSFAGLSATCFLSLVLCAQSSALARSGGASHDEPWNSEHIDRRPPEVRNSVLHMCRVRANAAHYFATYLDNARIIKLHFEHLNCEGRQIYRNAALCLHEEFALSGSHYRLTRHYYGRCDD
jgi:hypothetical protein